MTKKDIQTNPIAVRKDLLKLAKQILKTKSYIKFTEFRKNAEKTIATIDMFESMGRPPNKEDVDMLEQYNLITGPLSIILIREAMVFRDRLLRFYYKFGILQSPEKTGGDESVWLINQFRTLYNSGNAPDLIPIAQTLHPKCSSYIDAMYIIMDQYTAKVDILPIKFATDDETYYKGAELWLTIYLELKRQVNIGGAEHSETLANTTRTIFSKWRSVPIPKPTDPIDQWYLDNKVPNLRNFMNHLMKLFGFTYLNAKPFVDSPPSKNIEDFLGVYLQKYTVIVNKLDLVEKHLNKLTIGDLPLSITKPLKENVTKMFNKNISDMVKSIDVKFTTPKTLLDYYCSLHLFHPLFIIPLAYHTENIRDQNILREIIQILTEHFIATIPNIAYENGVKSKGKYITGVKIDPKTTEILCKELQLDKMPTVRLSISEIYELYGEDQTLFNDLTNLPPRITLKLLPRLDNLEESTLKHIRANYLAELSKIALDAKIERKKAEILAKNGKITPQDLENIAYEMFIETYIVKGKFTVPQKLVTNITSFLQEVEASKAKAIIGVTDEEITYAAAIKHYRGILDEVKQLIDSSGASDDVKNRIFDYIHNTNLTYTFGEARLDQNFILNTLQIERIIKAKISAKDEKEGTLLRKITIPEKHIDVTETNFENEATRKIINSIAVSLAGNNSQYILNTAIKEMLDILLADDSDAKDDLMAHIALPKPASYLQGTAFMGGPPPPPAPPSSAPQPPSNLYSKLTTKTTPTSPKTPTPISTPPPTPPASPTTSRKKLSTRAKPSTSTSTSTSGEYSSLFGTWYMTDEQREHTEQPEEDYYDVKHRFINIIKDDPDYFFDIIARSVMPDAENMSKAEKRKYVIQKFM